MKLSTKLGRNCYWNGLNWFRQSWENLSAIQAQEWAKSSFSPPCKSPRMDDCGCMILPQANLARRLRSTASFNIPQEILDNHFETFYAAIC